MFGDQELINLVRKYALLNAVSHNGKAESGAVVSRIMAERREYRPQSRLVLKQAIEIVSEINKLTEEQQRDILQSQFSDFLEYEMRRKRELSNRDSEKTPELPMWPDAVTEQVVTRFLPEPNGFMHVGHAKPAIISSEYARIYKGKFLLRFDDTNPSAEKKEYYDAFLDAFKWLKIKPDVIRNTSDDMERFYSLAEQMMKNSKAYVCTCAQEDMRELRNKGEACAHRASSVDQNISMWKKMLSRQIDKSEATLRFVGDMKSLNTVMRDPVLFRIVLEPHQLVGEKFSVWPTYDFAGPVEDSLDGVTHALRSKEYELRDELYHEILNSLGLRHPRIIEFSRLNLQNTTLSKRGLSRLVREKLVDGWDDPRLPTISGLRRRGFLSEAIREFILAMGISKTESEPTWDLLESINRKLLDPVSRRFFFVPEPIIMNVLNAPKMEVGIGYHPERREYGERRVLLGDCFYLPSSDVLNACVGSKLRLIDAYNVQITAKHEGRMEALYAGKELVQGVPKLQWVSAEGAIRLKVKVLGPLLLDSEFNQHSMKVVEGWLEASGAQIKIGEVIQFVRFGFCRMDAPGVAIRTHK